MCSTVVFPPHNSTCPNPDCDSDSLTPTELSRRGRIWSYTENRCTRRPRRMSQPIRSSRCTLAAVELADEGIVVLGQVAKGVRASELHVGMEMQLELDTLYRDDEHEYLVYVWAPA